MLSVFTVLAPNEVRVLEVLNERGEWVSAPPRKGTLVVNIGDQLQSCKNIFLHELELSHLAKPVIGTNGLYISTTHRVPNLSGLERYSILFFFSANLETVIKVCIPRSYESNDVSANGDQPFDEFVPNGAKVEYEDITAGEVSWPTGTRFIWCRNVLTDGLQMYKNTMIKFHRVATTHPVYSKYIIDSIHDTAQHESQRHLAYMISKSSFIH